MSSIKFVGESQRDPNDSGFWEPPPQSGRRILNSILKKVIDEEINDETQKLDRNYLSSPSVEIPSNVRSETLAYERYKYYKSKVLQAYHDHKIFMVYGGYATIRSALVNRGWLEKLTTNVSLNIQNISHCRLLRYASNGNDYERLVISKMLDRYPVYFVWQPKIQFDQTGFSIPFRNRIKRNRAFDFCTKEGLLSCIENSHWYTVEGISNVLVPKTHRLSSTKGDIHDFEYDYKLTQCLSLLNYIYDAADPRELFSLGGVVPASRLKFAVQRIEEAMAAKKNEDIDFTDVELQYPTEHEWRQFAEDADKIINKRMQFAIGKDDDGRHISLARRTLYDARQIWPTIKMDGHLNIWIIKPYNKCRGNGIVLMKDWLKILSYARKNCQTNYVVQKYIERPLLIYKTKFDIRQHFLVTITDALNIWVYTDCYLRFSSQEYNLHDFRESIHITNNAIQSKYTNGIRNELLPSQNMWSLVEFQRYLSEIDQEHVWSKKIYPRMKENIIAVIRSSLESIEMKMNAFELYGCDFILSEEFEPVLLEINCTPDMNPTTSVTARICPQLLNDLIKVVVDLPKNQETNTGNFELVHKILWTKVPPYSRGLVIQGKNLKVTSVRKLSSEKPSNQRSPKKRTMKRQKKIDKK